MELQVQQLLCWRNDLDQAVYRMYMAIQMMRMIRKVGKRMLAINQIATWRRDCLLL